MPIDPHWIEQTLGAKFEPAVRGELAAVSVDSREAKAGMLFVGVKTPSGHRQAYTHIAAQNRAAAAIVEERQPVALPQMVVADSTAALQKLAIAKRAAYTGKVIALTGSSGKTSTKELLAHLLGPGTHKTSGNLNNHLGVPMTILHAPMEAPYWVLEAGISTPGEMDALAEMIKPDAALITMIGSAHLEFLKTRAGIAAEKGKLLHAVAEEGLVVLHGEDAVYPTLQSLRAQTFVVQTGKTPLPRLPGNYEMMKAHFHCDKSGWEIKLEGKRYDTPLWSPGMARNAALCIALAQKQGVTKEEIETRLKSWPGVALRGNWVRYKEGPASQKIYLDAYNCNPEGLVDSLWRFERMAQEDAGRLYILSAMGELGEEAAALQKNAAAQVKLRPQDRVILVGSGTEAMAEGLTAAGMTEKQLTRLPNVAAVHGVLKEFSGECFIKGSHHGSQLYTLEKSCCPL